VCAYAIEHPAGICLFDTGQSARAARHGYHQWWHPYLRLARFELSATGEAGAQLDATSVRWVVLSHLHTDHVGGLAAFASADVLVSRTEWERASGFTGKLRGYVPQHWPHSLQPCLVDFTGPPVGPFPASHDVAGDGTLVLVPTPGHTPGHLSMIVAGECFLGGDIAHTQAELARVAPTITQWCEREGLTVLLAHGRG
jgi:glyoxylase-like metal-dependent hydrolase (beta-lactamase superfamily II)